MTDGPVFSPHPDDPPEGLGAASAASDQPGRVDPELGGSGQFGTTSSFDNAPLGADYSSTVTPLTPAEPVDRHASLSVGFATAAWVVVIILYLFGGIAFYWPVALALVAIYFAVRGLPASPKVAWIGGGSALLSIVAVALYFMVVVSAVADAVEPAV